MYREIELAACVDSLDVRQHERVSVGTATVAMILNRLLTFAATALFGTAVLRQQTGRASAGTSGIQAEDLNDDCLWRAFDWLSAHDPTALFAGIAAYANTTSFAVHGKYTVGAHRNGIGEVWSL